MIGPLAPTTFDLLELLSLHPAGFARDGLALRLGIKPSSAATRIKRAEDHGLVDVRWQRNQRDEPTTVRISALGMLKLRQAFAALDQRVAA